MRFIVFGAGAVGGVVGARLFQHAAPHHEVVLIARGAHRDAIANEGLRLESADGVAVLPIPVVGGVDELTFGAEDVVLLAMKTNDTAEALRVLAARAPVETPIVCLQNGVENERSALRHFANVYGVCVMCPTTHVRPGVVQANSSPVTGILDIGRYPGGVDDRCKAVAAAFGASTFVSEPRPDIQRWKYSKLIMNLGNAAEAACGPAARASELASRARREGVACLRAAGIDFVSVEEDQARRGDLLHSRPVGEASERGGSSWQSLVRGTGRIEADYLNGEIALLGRLHGVPTPVNELLQQVANDLAASGAPPATMTPEELLARSQVA